MPSRGLQTEPRLPGEPRKAARAAAEPLPPIHQVLGGSPGGGSRSSGPAGPGGRPARLFGDRWRGGWWGCIPGEPAAAGREAVPRTVCGIPSGDGTEDSGLWVPKGRGACAAEGIRGEQQGPLVCRGRGVCDPALTAALPFAPPPSSLSLPSNFACIETRGVRDLSRHLPSHSRSPLRRADSTLAPELLLSGAALCSEAKRSSSGRGVGWGWGFCSRTPRSYQIMQTMKSTGGGRGAHSTTVADQALQRFLVLP